MSVETLSGAPPLDVKRAKKLVKKQAKEARRRAKQRGQSGSDHHDASEATAESGAQRRSGSRLAPWLLTALLAVGGGAGSYYLMQQNQQVSQELGEARAASATAQQRAASAGNQLMSLEAELSKARGEFAAAQELAAKKAAEADELANKLSGLVSGGNGELVREADGSLNLQLVDKVLFRSGEAALTKRGMSVLADVGKALNEIPDKQIWVQGHTDSEPIGKDNALFASNWELSAARALTVVHYLEHEAGVDPRRLAAVAFGEHRPVSRRKKAKNRRIEIVLAPPKVALVKD